MYNKPYIKRTSNIFGEIFSFSNKIISSSDLLIPNNVLFSKDIKLLSLDIFEEFFILFFFQKKKNYIICRTQICSVHINSNSNSNTITIKYANLRPNPPKLANSWFVP